MSNRINSIAFTPTEPLQHDGKIYATITFRRPTLGTVAAMEAADTEFGKIIAFLSSTSGLPEGALRELDLEDMQRLAREIEPLAGAVLGQQAEEA